MIRNKCDGNIFQWDTNLVLDVPASDIVYVDFQSSDVIRVAVEDGSCRIPDEILETAGKKILWLCHDDQTREQFIFNVKARPMPPDHITTPTQRITFDSLVRDVRTSIEEADVALGAMMTSVEREVGDKMSSVDEKMSQVDADVSNALASVQEATERAEDASDGAERVNVESERVADGVMVKTTDREGNQTVTLVRDGQGSSYDDTELRNRIGQAEEDVAGISEHMDEIDTFTEELGEAVQTLNATKLEKPSSGIAVGKYFRVASIDDEGNPVLEVVDLPVATANSQTGLARYKTLSYGLSVDENGVQIQKASTNNINARTSNYLPIVPNNLVTAVDSVLCSTNANEALTPAQQAAAQARLGISGGAEKPWVLKATWTDPTQRCRIDLSGCKQLFIIGTTRGTAVVTLTCDFGTLNQNFVANGFRRHAMLYEETQFGIEYIRGSLGSHETQEFVNSRSDGYSWFGKSFANITYLAVSMASNVTELDVKIYAR